MEQEKRTFFFYYKYRSQDKQKQSEKSRRCGYTEKQANKNLRILAG